MSGAEGLLKRSLLLRRSEGRRRRCSGRILPLVAESENAALRLQELARSRELVQCTLCSGRGTGVRDSALRASYPARLVSGLRHQFNFLSATHYNQTILRFTSICAPRLTDSARFTFHVFVATASQKAVHELNNSAGLVTQIRPASQHRLGQPRHTDSARLVSLTRHASSNKLGTLRLADSERFVSQTRNASSRRLGKPRLSEGLRLATQTRQASSRRLGKPRRTHVRYLHR